MFEPSTDKRPAAGGWAVYVLAAVLVVLQLVFGAHIDVFGASPDFLLVLGAAVALLHGPRAGCAAGFACGLLFDLAGSGPVGLSALLGCIAGYALGAGRRNAFSEGWRAPLAAFAVAALAYNALYFCLLLALGTGVALGWAALARVLVGTVLDVAVAAVVFAVMARLCASGQTAGPGGVHLR